jgi:hypothetical protein
MADIVIQSYASRGVFSRMEHWRDEEKKEKEDEEKDIERASENATRIGLMLDKARRGGDVNVKTVTLTRLRNSFLASQFPVPLRSVNHPTTSMKVRLRQSLLLPRLRHYSQLAQKELDPQLNGYPQLPNVSRQSLPVHGWWDFQMRRNRGDTV